MATFDLVLDDTRPETYVLAGRHVASRVYPLSFWPTLREQSEQEALLVAPPPQPITQKKNTTKHVRRYRSR